MEQIGEFISWLRKYPGLLHKDDFIKYLENKYQVIFKDKNESFIRSLILKKFPDIDLIFFENLVFLNKSSYIDPDEFDEEYFIYLFKTQIEYKNQTIPILLKF